MTDETLDETAQDVPPWFIGEPVLWADPNALSDVHRAKTERYSYPLYARPNREAIDATAAAFARRSPLTASVPVTMKGLERADIADVLAKQSPEELSPEEKLIWILGDLMNAAENYFGVENPKRIGHIYGAACRILDEVSLPALSSLPAGAVGVETERQFANGPVRLGYEAALHLSWIADRLEHVHGENPNYDYMHRLREIADALRPARASPDSSAAAGEPVAWRWKQKGRRDAQAWGYHTSDPKVSEDLFDVEPLYASPVPSTALVEARWQTMDIAPKDGKHVLLCVQSGAFFWAVEGVFYLGEWFAAFCDKRVEPVYWAPKPKGFVLPEPAALQPSPGRDG